MRRRKFNYKPIKIKSGYRLRTKVKQQWFAKIIKSAGMLLLFVSITSVFFIAGRAGHKYLFASGRFNIEEITVSGLDALPESDLLSGLPVKYGDNLIATYFMRIAGPLKDALPEIKSVRIRRRLPGKISFIITERKPIAWIYHKDGAIGIDDENTCFPLRKNYSAMPEVAIDEPVISRDGVLRDGKPSKFRGDAVKLLARILKHKREVYSEIARLSNLKDNFVLKLRDNCEILWGPYNENKIERQIKYTCAVMEQAQNVLGRSPIEYIDLQLFDENRIIVKPSIKPAETKKHSPRRT
ncbi:MAG: FtsQ-type POTRA domain-containing protein [Elusimicrobiota bacterium]